ncbi:kinase-like domain-containing protein [Daldinia grandis]|nr:kinase-like domain-containing protein [Daldinia grandis]
MDDVPGWMHAGMYGNPGDFSEHYRAVNTLWQKYREEGGHVIRGFRDYRIDREEWAQAPFPKPGEVNPRDYNIKKNWERLPYHQEAGESTWPPFVLETSDLWDEPYRNNIRERCWSAARYFQRRPLHDLRLAKVLGYGGNGIALKFRSIRPPYDLVFKIGRQGWFSPDIRREERALQEVARAAHCIQTVPRNEVLQAEYQAYQYNPIDPYDSSDGEVPSLADSEDEIPDQERAFGLSNSSRKETHENNPEEAAAKREMHMERIQEQEDMMDNMIYNRIGPDPNDPMFRHDYLILEFVENGDLTHLIQRIESSKLDNKVKRVPNRVLWSFWLCLVRACTGLEYPPRMFHPGRHDRHDQRTIEEVMRVVNLSDPEGAPEWKTLGGELFEDVPAVAKRYARKQLVHFDIDAKNIFIGGLDKNAQDGEHAIIPRLKLADFGRMRQIKRNKGNQYYLRNRFVGKYGHYAPEQFGSEWDYLEVRGAMGWQVSEQKVAGNYGSPMNVWGIALTMWTLMTTSRPPIPPHQSPEDPLHYAALLMDDPELSYIDKDFRTTIMQCMRHHPDERPTLDVLIAQAKEGTHRKYEGETDAVIKKWVKTLPFAIDLTSPLTNLIYDAVEPDVYPPPPPPPPAPFGPPGLFGPHGPFKWPAFEPPAPPPPIAPHGPFKWPPLEPPPLGPHGPFKWPLEPPPLGPHGAFKWPPLEPPAPLGPHGPFKWPPFEPPGPPAPPPPPTPPGPPLEDGEDVVVEEIWEDEHTDGEDEGEGEVVDADDDPGPPYGDIPMGGVVMHELMWEEAHGDGDGEAADDDDDDDEIFDEDAENIDPFEGFDGPAGAGVGLPEFAPFNALPPVAPGVVNWLPPPGAPPPTGPALPQPPAAGHNLAERFLRRIRRNRSPPRHGLAQPRQRRRDRLGNQLRNIFNRNRRG